MAAVLIKFNLSSPKSDNCGQGLSFLGITICIDLRRVMDEKKS